LPRHRLINRKKSK